MNGLLSHYARLRRQLASMEIDLGLEGFGSDEISLICAIIDLVGYEGAASVTDLRSHILVRRLSKPTFYRALQRLIDASVVSKIGSERSGLYSVNKAALTK